MATIKNHFFENTNVKIVGKNYDDEEFVKVSSYFCLNDYCRYELNLKNNSVLTAEKLPFFIQCPKCNGTMICDSFNRVLSLYNKKIEKLKVFSVQKYNLAKILSLKRLYVLDLIKKNDRKKHALVDDFMPEFRIILESAPLFMEMDTIEHLESLTAEYAALISDYAKFKKEISVSKKLCKIYTNIYTFIEPEKNYKQIDFMKEFFSYKAQKPHLFPYIPKIGLIDDTTYKTTVADVIYCWGKAGLLEREKINNRIYFLKRKECAYEKLDIYSPARLTEISR